MWGQPTARCTCDRTRSFSIWLTSWGGARGMELAGDGRGAGQALLRGHLSSRRDAVEQPPERSPQGEPAPRWSKLGVHEEKKDSLEGGCWGVLGGEGEVVRGAVVGCGSLDPLWQDLGLSDPPGRSSPNSIRMRWLARGVAGNQRATLGPDRRSSQDTGRLQVLWCQRPHRGTTLGKNLAPLPCLGTQSLPSHGLPQAPSVPSPPA